MATKRISRHEIPADTGERSAAEEAFSKYWRPAIIALIVAGAGFIGVQVLGSNREGAEKDAQSLWLRAQQDMTNSQYASALDLANNIRDRFPNTPSGKRALLVRADALRASGDMAGARTAYEDAIGGVDDPILLSSAKRGLAVILEDAGEYGRAAELYEDLGASAEPTGGRAFDLRSAARAHRNAGDLASAAQVLESLITTYKGATERTIADLVYLSEIELAEIRIQS